MTVEADLQVGLDRADRCTPIKSPLNKNSPKCVMRMLDADGERSVRVLQLYLTVREARELQTGLARLLNDPEVNDHVREPPFYSA